MVDFWTGVVRKARGKRDTKVEEEEEEAPEIRVLERGLGMRMWAALLASVDEGTGTEREDAFVLFF
jgi:hypothetical protein